MRAFRILVLTLPLLGACAPLSPGVGPDIAIPVFAADDQRVSTDGFVRETRRLDVERDGVRHTLMAFVVGDTLTLGAMVKGEFDGTVDWDVGGRALSFAFDTGASLREVPVTLDGGASDLIGQGATFRGTAWVNIELRSADWIANGTPLQLVFRPKAGAPLTMPDPGHHYRAQLVPK